jgi:hypothetical protein
MLNVRNFFGILYDKDYFESKLIFILKLDEKIK